MDGHTIRKQFIGLYQAVAGSIGITATLEHAPRLIAQLNPAVRMQALVLFSCAGLAFLVTGLAGVLLLRSKKAGRPISLLVQLAQIFSWSSSTTKYSFIAGLYAGPLWNVNGIEPVAGATASFQLAWSGPLGESFFAINCVPLVFIVLLSHRKTELLQA